MHAQFVMEDKEVVRLTVVKALSLRYRVERCVYSTNGKRLAACLGDYSVKIYDVLDCACDDESATHADKHSSPAPVSSPILQALYSLKGHSSNVWSIHFSQDSQLLCSSSSDTTVKVWHLPTQETISTFTQHSDIVWCCSFVPCHPSLVASGSSDKTLKIWDYTTGSILYDLKQYYSEAVETLSFSIDGTRLCTGSRDGRIVVWRNMFSKAVENPKDFVLYQASDWIRFVHFSEHDSNLLITDGGSNVVLVWDLSDIRIKGPDQLSKDVTDTSTAVKRVRFSDKHNDTEVSSLSPKLELEGHLNTVWDACFVPVSDKVNLAITCSGDRSIRSVLFNIMFS